MVSYANNPHIGSESLPDPTLEGYRKGVGRHSYWDDKELVWVETHLIHGQPYVADATDAERLYACSDFLPEDCRTQYRTFDHPEYRRDIVEVSEIPHRVLEQRACEPRRDEDGHPNAAFFRDLSTRITGIRVVTPILDITTSPEKVAQIKGYYESLLWQQP